MSGLAGLLAHHAEPGIYRWHGAFEVDAVRHTVEHAGWRFAEIDGWHGPTKAEFLEMSVETWDKMHAVNARGTFLCMREAIRQMQRQGRGGAIVNVSTIGTVIPTIMANTHYDSSKGGVNAMTRTAAYEFAGDRIRINAVLPNAVDTPGSRGSRAGGFTARGPMSAGLARLPLGRLADPSEMASVILFLCGKGSGYMTGQLLNVDGGFTVS